MQAPTLARPTTKARARCGRQGTGWGIEAHASTRCEEDGGTSACSASHSGHVECIRLLHAARADICIPDKQGVTPEQAAAAQGHGECAELLRQLAAADLAAGGGHDAVS